MPTFKAPSYAKLPNPKTGVMEPCYTFAIQFAPNNEQISFIANTTTEISLQGLQTCVLENVDWWNTFVGEFLQASSKLFSKPYTVENINKVAKHTMQLKGNSAPPTKYPVNVLLLPKNIQIVSGNFIINWEYTTESMVIEFPDADNNVVQDNGANEISLNLPDSKPTKSRKSAKKVNDVPDGLEELNIADLPEDTNATEQSFEIDSPEKLYDRQRMKESRLKAKLAVYKAQRQMAEYYKKYGEDDLSDSDTDISSDDQTDDQTDDDIQV
jgi:hypothetical protein